MIEIDDDLLELAQKIMSRRRAGFLHEDHNAAFLRPFEYEAEKMIYAVHALSGYLQALDSQIETERRRFPNA